MKKFVLVGFDGGDTCEVVPDNWVETVEEEGIRGTIAYPSKPELRKIRTLVTDRVVPKSTWVSYPVNFLFQDGEFCYCYRQPILRIL